MHGLATIQRMNAEATEQAMTQLAEEQVLADIDAERAEAVAQKFNDWRDTIDLEVVRKWYLFIPGDGTPFNEIVDTYEGMRDEDNRLVVYVDECADSPLDWGWDVEMHDIDDYRMWRGWEQPGDDLANFAREMHYRFGRAGQPEKRDRAIHLYKVLIGDTREFKVHEWRGYSQSDWATVLEIGENIGMYTEYAAWRRGDVFIVVHEKREQWTNADETAEMDTWEGIDSLGGCYLDDNYTALDVAREYFDVDLDK